MVSSEVTVWLLPFNFQLTTFVWEVDCGENNTAQYYAYTKLVNNASYYEPTKF